MRGLISSSLRFFGLFLCVVMLDACRLKSPPVAADPTDSSASHEDDTDEGAEDEEWENPEPEAAGTSQTFVVAGTLNVGRKYPLAAVLKNGKVLVVGGQNGSNQSLASAEIFSPSSGVFTVTGSLQVIDDGGGTIVALDDGTALVTGSYLDGSTKVPFAEIYDPNSGTFSPTDETPLAIRDHGSNATLLDDGRVLYNGGTGTACSFSGSDGPVTLSEIYNPQSGTFEAAPYTGTRTGAFAAKRADGRVLIGGGQRCFISGIFGPMLTDNLTAGIFDPANDSYTAVGNMPYAADRGLALQNGWVLASGGAYAQYYNFDTSSWTSFAAIEAWGANEAYAMTVLDNGDVFAFGGDWDHDHAQLFHLSDAGVFSFSDSEDLPYGGDHPTVVRLLSGNLLILGSEDDITKAQKYFP